ncbi:MAG: hypothetical protein ACRDRR_18250 [Pseudonocardiaceae bacterium]
MACRSAFVVSRESPAVSIRHHRARVASLTRFRGAGHPATVQAETDLKAARLAAAIKREVDSAPPLSAEQIEQLRGLLPALAREATPA